MATSIIATEPSFDVCVCPDDCDCPDAIEREDAADRRELAERERADWRPEQEEEVRCETEST